MRRNNKGLTLIEVAVCLVILVILAAVAAPNFTSMTEDAQAETMRAIASDIEMWIAQGLSRGVSFNSLTSNTDLLDDIASNVESDYRGGDSSISVTAGSAKHVNISFDAVGGAKTATLEINDTGRVSFKNVSGFNQYSVVNGDLKKS